jgi:hypothetical protein
MDIDLSALPDDVNSLKAALLASVARGDIVAAALANEQAKRADDHALIAHLKLQIETRKRDKYGPKSERAARLNTARTRRSPQDDTAKAMNDMLNFYPVPRRWPDLSDQQRGRARAPWHCPWPKIMAVRRFGSRGNGPRKCIASSSPQK